MTADESTTIALKRRTKERLDSAKPYNSLSADEFVSELLDAYESNR